MRLPTPAWGLPPALRETADKPLRLQCRGHTQLRTVRLPLGVSPCIFHVCEMELQQSRKDQGEAKHIKQSINASHGADRSQPRHPGSHLSCPPVQDACRGQAPHSALQPPADLRPQQMLGDHRSAKRPTGLRSVQRFFLKPAR